MSLWFVVLLVIVIAMVFGPISLLRPSPAQKRKERLRAAAAKMGVHFCMRRLPALKTDLESAPIMPVYYLPPSGHLKLVSDWCLQRTGYIHEGNFHGVWDWYDGQQAPVSMHKGLLHLLPQVPASVMAITQGQSGTCMFWREIEGEDKLPLIHSLLQQIDQLAAPSEIN